MKSIFYSMRASILGFLYKKVWKPILFRFDPEQVHDSMTRLGVALGRFAAGKVLIKMLFNYQNAMLRQTIRGIEFENPIGLSAGFDKNAELTDILPSVGFGFAEVGSITGEPCEGNPRPRLWRLPKSQSLGVYYGLKNDGCEEISARLSEKRFAIPVGASVAMTNCLANLELDRVIDDYAKAFRAMEPIARYITVNISCPNTLGGQPFVDLGNLDRLFHRLDAIPTTKPVFIKLSPDMSRPELDALLDAAERHCIDGIVCANLTKRRDGPSVVDANVPKVGGLSGKPVKDVSDELLAHIYRRAGQRFILVGSGGVFSAEDAYRKIKNGASLVQLITGMIFEGPQLVGEINRGLVELLKRDGYGNIREAIGKHAAKNRDIPRR